MHLSIEVYIPGEELVLKAKEILYKRDVSIILILFLLVLIEVPIFILIFWKLAPNKENLLLWSTLFVLVILLIFSLVIFFYPSRVYMLRADRRENLLEVGFVKNLFIKKINLIPAGEIKGLYIKIYNIKDKNAVFMRLERENQKALTLFFFMNLLESKEKLAKVFLNLAKILNLKGYSAKELSTGLHLVFNREFSEEASNPLNTQEIIIEKEISRSLSNLNIPQLEIEEESPMRIVFKKKPNFWDVLRLIGIFVVFPLIFVIIYFADEPSKPFLLTAVLLIYSFMLYHTRYLLSPMTTIVDRLQNRLIIRKPFFQKTFLLSEVEAWEIRDQRISRTGTIIIHFEAKLRGGKRYQLFYIEIPTNREMLYEVLGQIEPLIQHLEKMLGVSTEFRLKEAFT